MPQTLRTHLRPTRMNTMNAFAKPLTLCLALLLFTAAAAAQYAPAGNELPDNTQTTAPSAIHSLHAHAGHNHAPMTRQEHQEFAKQVDLDAFRKLAVFDGGRVKILDTLAREQLTSIYGKSRWQDYTWDTADEEDPRDRKKLKYDPVFTYLDIVFHASYYADKPILYVEVLPFREKLLANLPEDDQEKWKQLGRISWMMFANPAVQSVYQGPETNQTEIKGRNQLFGSADAFVNAGQRLLMISPPPGQENWAHIAIPVEQHDEVILPASTTVRQAQLSDLWVQLQNAWSHGDAEAVNSLLEIIALQLPAQNPSTYPAEYRLSLEHVYNITGKFTIGYWLYAIATVAMILALGTGRKTLLTLGVSMLLLGFLAHAASFAIRAILSGRWAIHNQYESFIAISLFAVFVGMILMFTKKIWVFGAASAALGAIALMVANLWAIPSNEVGQVAAILGTSRILYVHVNMVLVSYSLIALSFFVSLSYLYAHYVKSKEAMNFVAAGTGNMDAAAGDSKLPGRKKLLADLDQAQLTLMQLAFWLLGVGILLGAYWADHSWGRWWAWDPKETWALITWIVYLIAIHVRFGVRDRGLVTAWLSVVGFIIMLWCYKGVNLLLPGLHAYA
ncbi:cytochrome c biogenesis protein CcsA [Algisphaera agarilytica]|uniref:Cytochrome c-type biogenesis protein CcsB n=1 Tax=Algisphaera agarilytica TaxID=1385975 RepID=A0A7X0LLE2_9BACT|nr:cytochrome c biogenesis protein CcsA [Algisphaera agarilytica]MBB6430922.1 cytochrome c-type biogenesis protein CcsB [Algisphaera agarilytica]